MSGSTITAIGGVLIGVIGALSTVIKLWIDKRSGMRGDYLKAQEIGIERENTSFKMQDTLLKNVMAVNDDLTERLDRMEEREKERDKKIREQESRINAYELRVIHLERVVRIRMSREEILLNHIALGLGPPPPELPPLPADLDIDYGQA